MIIFIWVVQKFSKQKKHFIFVKLSYPLKGFNYPQDFFRILLSKRARRSLDSVRVVPEAYVLELSILIAQKWGRISPAVYWWHQNQSSYNIRRCTPLFSVAKKICWPQTHAQMHTCTRTRTKSCMEAGTLPKKIKWMGNSPKYSLSSTVVGK